MKKNIPERILNNQELKSAITVLPENYDFEIEKTLWQIEEHNATRVALQFPEGLLIFSMTIADIISRFAGVETVILGDVTYGACCVDDFSSKALGCDFLVHYGHSCLVPITITQVKTMYVFVHISIDVAHLVESIKHNFSPDNRFVLSGTIQFSRALQSARQPLQDYFADLLIPQTKPLSPGEVLGCTSPRFENKDILVFVADGRFHLESIMIHNPDVTAYKYDPYDKKITKEVYQHDAMKSLRKSAIDSSRGTRKWGIILGTLGRQGNPKIFQRLTKMMKQKGIEYTKILLSEIFPSKLALFQDVDVFVQVGCPRLSIDWGHEFSKPVLNPYEATVALQQSEWRSVYPMDFYSDSGGVWTNYYKTEEEKQQEAERRKANRKARIAKLRARKKLKKVKLEFEQDSKSVVINPEQKAIEI